MACLVAEKIPKGNSNIVYVLFFVLFLLTPAERIRELQQHSEHFTRFPVFFSFTIFQRSNKYLCCLLEI